MKIGIVLVNYNNNKMTLDCLESLSRIEKDNYDIEAIVVDNNSNPQLKIDKDYKSMKTSLIKNTENFGFAKGSNIGIKQALRNRSEYVLILNNDTIHDKNFLINLAKSMKDPSVGIASPKIYFYKGREFHKDRYSKKDLGNVIWYAGGILDRKNVLARHRGVDEVDRGQFDEWIETDFATGCAMLVKKEVFEKTGYFDEKYFLYLEDLDFSQRVRREGFQIVFQPSSYIWHYNAASTGGSGGNTHDYFITRNRMLFGNKYSGLRTKFALARESLKLLLFGRKWQRIGIRDYYLGNFGPGSFKI